MFPVRALRPCRAESRPTLWSFLFGLAPSLAFVEGFASGNITVTSDQGDDLLDVAPNDTIKNGAWDIKQQYVPVTVDGLTLAKCNTTEAVANLLTIQWEQARMQMANNIGTGIYSDVVTDAKQIDGLKGAVDAGGVATSYAGLVRASNTTPVLVLRFDADTDVALARIQDTFRKQLLALDANLKLPF